MNRIVSEMKAAIFYNEGIEDLTPLDIQGFPDEEKMEILYLYSKYGKDPERQKICLLKLETLRNETRRNSL